MAENTKKSPDDRRRQPGRLQRKAPASIQINRATDWNVAIPLLSPLITSPVSSDLTAAVELCSNSSREKEAEREAEKPSATATAAAVKEWNHPAAPFCFDPAPLVKFVCTGSNDR
ncbi:unnamed protein product [Cuscuta campestris]|uniref:Uncharacterized protein n=1 Tax=Cuscuta campestris TaxID=132261 RepID=A0A484KJM0_9ASTE|nr:unnamed protein product [Cuscuta campestris]